MKAVSPKFVIALLLVVAFVVYVKLSNPNKKYSTEGYWLTASVADVDSIPQEALEPGNRNGGVLMWASMVVDDPDILSALVGRGADVNESDAFFGGTPLSAAAASTTRPAVIDRLVELGAEIDKVVGSNNKTPLIIAAELNPNPIIIKRLVHHGADTHYKDLTGRNALEQAIRFSNNSVVVLLKDYMNPLLSHERE